MCMYGVRAHIFAIAIAIRKDMIVCCVVLCAIERRLVCHRVSQSSDAEIILHRSREREKEGQKATTTATVIGCSVVFCVLFWYACNGAHHMSKCEHVCISEIGKKKEKKKRIVSYHIRSEFAGVSVVYVSKWLIAIERELQTAKW